MEAAVAVGRNKCQWSGCGWVDFIRIKIRESEPEKRWNSGRGGGGGRERKRRRVKIIRDVPETTENINQVKFADSGIYRFGVGVHRYTLPRAREREREWERLYYSASLSLALLYPARPSFFLSVAPARRDAASFLLPESAAALNVPCRRIFALAHAFPQDIPLFRRIKA